MPVIAIVLLPVQELVMLSVEETLLLFVGVKVTINVSDCPGLIVTGKVAPVTLRPATAGLKDVLAMVMVELPELVKVTF